MPVYQYKGLRTDGGQASGSIDAESLRIARLKLRSSGVYLTDLAEQARPAGLAAGGARPGPASFSLPDLALCARQLGTLLAASLPLVEALGVLIEQSEKKPVQEVLAAIREQIREGRSLSASLETFPSDFSSVFVAMVRTGEASGTLDQILFQLADFLEQQLALRQKVGQALLYPALLSGVSILILAALMVFVVPKITAVFADLKQALPWPTVLLIHASRLLVDYGLLLAAGAGVLAVAARRAAATAAGRMAFDRIVLRLPLLGRIVRMVAVSRLANTLATMLASGVPLLDALGIAQRVMNNRVLEEAIQAARRNIREGESIADPLKRSGEFPPLVTRLIAVGERSGEVEVMLRRLSHIYDGEVNRVIAKMTALLEPAMILVMGVVVLFIVTAILLPIFQMSEFVK
jgi:general secretion pathway protein F